MMASAEVQIMSRDMDRESIERRLAAYFGAASTALAAALSEVKWSFECPAFLAGVLDEMTGDIAAEEAVILWAIRRGRIWS
jgi:hypothetical protein